MGLQNHPDEAIRRKDHHEPQEDNQDHGKISPDYQDTKKKSLQDDNEKVIGA